MRSEINARLLPIFLLVFATRSPAQSEPTERGNKDRTQDADVGEVTAWLRKNALPLSSLEPGDDFADLRPFGAALADVSVVGLGEATHGTREFFRFKHRTIEFLIHELGFTVVALEANYAGLGPASDYVQGGDVSRAEALQSLGAPVWKTEEMAALVDWLRDYNATVEPSRKVKFVGYDMQDMGGAWRAPKYLERVAPEKVTEMDEFLGKLGKAVQASFGGAKDDLKALRPEVDHWLAYFVLHEATFIGKTSREEYEDHLHRTRLLAQSVDLFSREWDDTRDRYMAENALYLLNREPVGSKVIVWAHNAHVATGALNSAPGGGRSMGSFLRQSLETKYYALGLTFSEGSFQATSTPSNGEVEYFEYKVGPAGAGSSNWMLAQAGLGNYLIDLRHTTKSDATRRWITTPRGLGWVGGYAVAPEFEAQWAAGDFLESTLSDDYDGLVFIERTTRARPLTLKAFR